MSFFRLVVCVSGVYAMFLLWAVAQERLSEPFQSTDGVWHSFKYPLFIATSQSTLSAFSALLYLLLRNQPLATLDTRLLLRFLQCSLYITVAAPFGFAALAYLSYPAMVLAKSCKLIPVLLMNVLLYRRKFKPYKYLVVSMVTLGISIFMAVRPSQSSSSPTTSLVGLTYLLVNLILDGLTNSTQDDIFASYPHLTGQQMMLFINTFSTLLSLSLSLLPLPHIPIIHPSKGGSDIISALSFIHSHPSIILPLAQFALTGALGQLFIFETLQHFGSLTLVTITLTRKLFTMLLSVIIYNHKLSSSQWLGAAIVFAGISVEAYVKRNEIHAKRIIEEKEKAGIKEL